MGWSLASIPLGYLVTGLVIEQLGSQQTILVYGAAILLSGLGAASLVRRRRDSYRLED